VIEMSFWYAETWYAQPEKLIWLVLNPSHAFFRPAALSSLPYFAATCAGYSPLNRLLQSGNGLL